MKKFHFGILAVPFIIVVWMFAARHYPPIIFPGPWRTLLELKKQLMSPDYYHHIGISLYRLFFGFVIAAVSAFVLGLLAGISKAFRQFLTPMVALFQATPPMAWAPLLILMLDLGNAPMIAVIVIAAFFPIVVNVIQGMERIKITHIRAAQTLGASRLQLAWHVYLPEVMPSAFTGIVVGFGIAWRSLVAAEMIGGSAGIGWLISSSGQIGNSPLVMVGIITIGILAMFFEFVLIHPLKKRFASWESKA
ncbi:ABC transporter permease [Paenibacillus dokdonensis]|uniref:ABC transporter permease n=1 Tax=Paenibacillus dokdonensis TaxID=2567944 RepID=A0ABU6GHK8_9BACL|nr:ABC transporter permease [Paenibacillus dokdonensis]MEC0238859.1 ABC transporter permease [Paenibacillus dokdonensis]